MIGHTPFTCAPMYTARLQDADGTDVLRFYEYERVRGLCYQMDFWLDRDRLMSCVRIENPHDTVVPMYWWSNMATPEFPGGRVAVPADSAYNNSDGLGIKNPLSPSTVELTSPTRRISPTPLTILRYSRCGGEVYCQCGRGGIRSASDFQPPDAWAQALLLGSPQGCRQLADYAHRRCR